MFNHSCQANAVLVGVHHENPSIIKWLGHLDQGSAEDSSQRMNKTKHVIALRDIAFGEEISISYICLKVQVANCLPGLIQTHLFRVQLKQGERNYGRIGSSGVNAHPAQILRGMSGAFVLVELLEKCAQATLF